MDPGDHRLGQAHDGQHQAAGGGEGLLVVGAGRIGAQILEVVAGAKPGTGAGDHHQLDRIVLVDRVERRLKVRHQSQGQGIAGGGTVQGQSGDAIRIIAQQDRLIGGGGGLDGHKFRSIPVGNDAQGLS